MRIKEVGLEIGITINVGNYESIRPAGNATVILDEDDNINDAISLARRIALSAFTTASKDLLQIRTLTSEYQDEFIREVIKMVE